MVKRDLLLGLVVSVGIHAAFLWSGIFDPEPATPKVAKIDVATVDIIQIPVLEPEEPDVFESTETIQEEPIGFAPPMLADAPAVAMDTTSFAQKLQPPPPPGIEPPQGVVTIPKTSVRGGPGGNMSNIFNPANLDQQPNPRFQAKPVYPFEMRRAGIAGEVLVGFIVDSNGEVRDAYAIRSTQREFEQAAIQAVAKWKFKPGRKAGRAVNTRMQVPIVFNIDDA